MNRNINFKLKKSNDSEGQRLISLPKVIIDILRKHPITKQVFITDIGYFPKVIYKNEEFLQEISQHILIYCVEGKGWIELNNKKYIVNPSQIIIIPAHTPFNCGSTIENTWTIYRFHFTGDISNNIVNLFLRNAKKYQANIGFSENRIRLFEEIYTNLDKGFIIDNLLYVNMVFYHFLSSMIYEEKFNFADTKNEEDRISLLLDHLENNIGTTFKLDELAAFTNLSVSHFSTLFRAKTGYSPIGYVNHKKVQKACQQLVFSQNSIKQISVNLGFEDPLYFSRLFSKLVGISPLDYRRKNKF